MSERQASGANQAAPLQCSNPACQTTFTTPVQQCLTCGALLSGMLLSERFRIEALLGRGGMGAVYRAIDLALSRQVAVKVLAPGAGLAGDAPAELRARFFREARLAAQLDHPNIVPVLHFDIDGPLAYLVMPLLTGGTLARRTRPRQPVDPAVVAGWLHQIAAALDYAHQRPHPIVHRDVKPGNLLFHEDGRLCLADFGVARVVAGSESSETAQLTRAGVVLGSLSYMAPEQINGHAVPASDQYSTGVLLYELLTGALPFEAADNYGLIIQHVNATPVPPSEHAPNLPADIDAVVLRALAKQPEERFPTMSMLAAAFEKALTSAPTARILAGLPRATMPADSPLALSPAEDPRGDMPTQAATMLHHSAGMPPSFQGAPLVTRPDLPPYQAPPQPPRHNRWMLGAFVGLAMLLLCVMALIGLRVLGQNAKSHANTPTGVGTVTQLPSPTPTTQADYYQALLAAAENGAPSFQDPLTSGRGWVRAGNALFVAGDGLHLSSPVGREKHSDNNTAQNSSAFHDRVPFSNCDIEVDLRFSGSQVAYGFAFLPPIASKHAIVLVSNGSFVIATVVQRNGIFTVSNEQQSSDSGLAVAPNMTYHLAMLIQGTQVSFFLAPQGQPLQYILTTTYSPAFDGSGVFALVNFTPNDQPPTELVYSNLVIYPLA
jgi:serine/threonine protein kinase